MSSFFQRCHFSVRTTGVLIGGGLLVGGAMEFFMIKTGFYDTVLRKEAEYRYEHREEIKERRKIADEKIAELKRMSR